jgi:guanylate kinase
MEASEKRRKIHFSQPTFLVLSGFSGTGKTTIRHVLMEKIRGSKFLLSVTTRPCRSDETEGIDYHFINQEEFNKLIEENLLLEWVEVHNHLYGTLLEPVLEAQNTLGLFIFDVDVHGGLFIKKHFPDAILIFLKTPSIEELKRRLEKRLTDSPEDIEHRLQRIPEEEELSKQYDHIIINDNAEEAAEKICTIIREFNSY